MPRPIGFLGRHSETTKRPFSYAYPIYAPIRNREPTGECEMKSSVMLTVTSLLSILLLSLHIAGDIALGFAAGGLANLFGIATLVVYLCGTLLLSDRRSGLVIVLLGSIIAAGMPVIHMTGAG